MEETLRMQSNPTRDALYVYQYCKQGTTTEAPPLVCPNTRTYRLLLTLLGPQPRLGDKLLII